MRIAIIGAGKMGAFIAEALGKGNTVGVFDLDRAKVERINGVEKLNELSDIKNFGPEMLINSVSLQNTVKAFESAIPYLNKDCILADIASVKGGIKEYYEKAGFRFVSTHPMFGPTHAKMTELRGYNAIIIRESDPEGAEFFRKFYEQLGLKIFEYDFREHDRMMAYSLSTPFSASLVFAACVDKTAVPGTNFAKHMALAKGILSEDDHLLAEVLFNPHSLKELEKITNKLEFLKHVIKGRDFEEAKRFFEKLRKNIGDS